jgi:hypothetical protein
MALQGLPDYQPINPAYSLPQIVQHQVELTQAELEEQLAEEALVRARARRVLASHTYHDAVVGARAQVIAQYGPDATAVALVGLTRKSERKQPAKRKPAA